jgi:peptidoglycan hydrolase-like protein with peptidoglycan-binding domain
MRKIVCWVAAISMAVLAWGASPDTAKKKAPASKKPAPKTSTARSGKKGSTWRNRQSAPTPERYKEIEAALAAKGYLPQQHVNGKWDETSVEALKRFQSDQHIAASGKINSLSLIALGLGPKHETPPETAGADR